MSGLCKQALPLGRRTASVTEPEVWAPHNALRGQLHHLARPRIIKVAQAELDRIHARGTSKFIHERLQREDVQVGAEAAQCHGAVDGFGVP